MPRRLLAVDRRGSVVIFTALISRIFLRRLLKSYHYLGIALVLAGTIIVGADAVLNPDTSGKAPPNPPLGNLLIVAAQVIVAVQMCVEEVFVGGKDVPALQAVGELAPYEQNEPGGHSMHSVSPLVDWYLPLGHESQLLLPGATVNAPGLHSVGAVARAMQ